MSSSIPKPDFQSSRSKRRSSIGQGAALSAAGSTDSAAPDPQPAEVRAEGFLPGEDIAIAPITGHTDAGKDGTVRALLDPAEYPNVREVVLVGRVSGTLAVRRLPVRVNSVLSLDSALVWVVTTSL